MEEGDTDFVWVYMIQLIDGHTLWGVFRHPSKAPKFPRVLIKVRIFYKVEYRCDITRVITDIKVSGTQNHLEQVRFRYELPSMLIKGTPIPKAALDQVEGF